MATQKKETWANLDHDTRLARITALWNEGLSDAAIASRLSATKGQIVGYRHTHLPKVTGATRGKPEEQGGSARVATASEKARPKPQAAPLPPPIETVPETAPPPPTQKPKETRMQRPRSSRIVAEPAGEPSSGFVGKMTSDWTKQCGHRDEDNRQCGFHFTVRRGPDLRCNLHADEIQ